MSEVKVHLAGYLAEGEHVVLQPDYDSLKFDFDRVTAELDAVRETLENSYTAEDHERLVAKGQELNVKYIEKLEQLLTEADELADVLEGQLAESERKRREFVAAVKVETDQIEAKHSSCVVVPEGYAVVPIKPTKAMRDACQVAGKLPVWCAMMAAALKPAEPAKDEHVCTGCASKG